MKESEGNTNGVRSLEFYGMWAYKIPDVRGSRFMANKPCDIVAESKKGRFIAIEGKVMNSWSNFNDKWLRPNQVIMLDDAAIKRGGKAFIFLYVAIKADKKRKVQRCHRLVVFEWTAHREALKGKGYGADVMRAQKVGVWYEPFKDDNDKVIYPIKNLMSL